MNVALRIFSHVLVFALILSAWGVYGQTDSTRPVYHFNVLDAIYEKKAYPKVPFHRTLIPTACLPWGCFEQTCWEVFPEVKLPDQHAPVIASLEEDMVLFNPVDSFLIEQRTADPRASFYHFPPPSTRYYMDTAVYGIYTDSTQFEATKQAILTHFNTTNTYYRPFYFSKFEVTNKEYRQFVHYVRDSIAKTILGGRHILNKGKENERLNWDVAIQYGNEATHDSLRPLYFVDDERWWGRREIDVRQLNYRYAVPSNAAVKTLNVYPDTLSWIKAQDLNNYFHRQYFWHPAFDDYPVVGITYHQAMAFCHWKSEQLQREIDPARSRYVLEVTLPNSAEWEFVASLHVPKFYEFHDHSWLTDLVLLPIYQPTPPAFTRNMAKVGEEVRMLRNSRQSLAYRGLDGCTYTHPVNISSMEGLPWHDKKTRKGNKRPIRLYRRKWRQGRSPYRSERKAFKKYKARLMMNVDPNGISGMGCNVSEWQLDNYQQNWLAVTAKRRQMLSQMKTADWKPLSELEMHYDAMCDPKGQMVRGANAIDERYDAYLEKNLEGIHAKTYVSPDSAHAMLGFRYVVHVEKVK